VHNLDIVNFILSLIELRILISRSYVFELLNCKYYVYVTCLNSTDDVPGVFSVF